MGLPSLDPSLAYTSETCAAGVRWYSEQQTYVFAIGAMYLVTVFLLFAVMKTRSPWNLRRALALWNLLLGIFSIAGAIRTAPHLISTLLDRGIVYTVCTDPLKWYCDGATGFWVHLFILSKVPELLDTYFIVLRKRPLIFLHYFHHVTVMLYCWHAFSFRASNGLWFAAFNYVVHAIMYPYFAFATLGWRTRWSFLITQLQILQMVVGIAVQLGTGYMLLSSPDECEGSLRNVQYGLAMYASYLVLFVHFYLSSKRAKRAQKDTKAGKRA